MKIKAFLLFIAVVFFFSCKINTKKEDGNIKRIVCTTGMLGDAVKNLVGEDIEVITLMGPGVDPHLYKATQGDLRALSKADVIVYNGLHLEGKMTEVFKKLENQKHMIVAADGIKTDGLINNTDFQGAYDPHLWFDVSLWQKVVINIGTKLASISDSLNNEIEANTKDYARELESLHQKVIQTLNQLDSSKKILITAHDAFGYFGRAYDFEVRGLQGISTSSEYGLRDISDLVNFIVEKEIKAVFVESSVSEKSLKAVVEGCQEKGHTVKIGGQLFSDAMGTANSPEGTYVGMVTYNCKTIVEGLK